MKATKTIDRCVEILKFISFSITPFRFDYYCSEALADELIKSTDKNKGSIIRSYYKHSLGKDIFMSDSEALRRVFNKDNLFESLTQSLALLYYVIFPPVSLGRESIKDESTLKRMKDEELWIGEPYSQVVLEVIQEDPITIKDIEYELIGLCSNIKEIPLCLKVLEVKLEEAISSCLDKEVYSMDDILFTANDNVYSKKINSLKQLGVVNSKEAETLAVYVSNIIKYYNICLDTLKLKYDKLSRMSPNYTKPTTGFVQIGSRVAEVLEENPYSNLAENLLPYIKGASDADLKTIIELKCLPTFSEPKEWLGTYADAYRFCYKFCLTNKEFNNCFTFTKYPGGKLHNSHKKGITVELEKSIWDIISKYPK